MAKDAQLGRLEQEQLRERKILRAAIEELASSDYGGMTIEGVAARAGVAKTTLYRKWETKAELMRAALLSVVDMYKVVPTGVDLRSNLLQMARTFVEFMHSFEGQSLMRLGLLQHPEPELAKIAHDLHAKQMAELSALFDAAVARGEISRDVDALLLLDMLCGAIPIRGVMKNEPVDEELLQRSVDLLLAAANRSPSKLARSKSAKRRKR
jgi:AcrR family transcriptional regulator